MDHDKDLSLNATVVIGPRYGSDRYNIATLYLTCPCRFALCSPNTQRPQHSFSGHEVRLRPSHFLRVGLKNTDVLLDWNKEQRNRGWSFCLKIKSVSRNVLCGGLSAYFRSHKMGSFNSGPAQGFSLFKGRVFLAAVFCSDSGFL